MLIDRGLCGSLNGLGIALLDSVGYSTRMIRVRVPRFAELYASGSGSHMSAEVYCDGSWSIVDPWLDLLIEQTSFQEIAQGDSIGTMRVLFHTPRHPEAFAQAGLLPADQWITLRDYAATRSYKRHRTDLFHIESTDVDDEARLFAAEPRFVPDPPFEELWPEQELTVYVRVRGLSVATDFMANRFFGHGPGKRPTTVNGSPWTTMCLRFDLRSAYGPAELTADFAESE